MARIFNDSKTFVDMKLRQSPDATLALFDEFMLKHNDKPKREEITKWVNETFEPRGMEFETWVPDDYKKNPSILSKINDKEFRNFAQSLNDIWLELGRQMKKEVKQNSELYSIIYVENPVIVPGGRFLEFYYWDSYWIIRGLLISEMRDVSKIEIFANLTFKFIEMLML
jgi:alpha,alpha-trehalase